MTTTKEQQISENSQQEAVLDEQPSNTTEHSEPEINTTEAVNQTNYIQTPDVPEKFRNKDGSTNLNALVKSYKELEPLINEKANWSKEKETWGKEKNDLISKIKNLENKNPYDLSAEEKMNISKMMYEKMLDKAKDKGKATLLLEELKSNITEEKFKELESLFPIDVIKQVSLDSALRQKEFKENYIKDTRNKEYDNAMKYLAQVNEKNAEVLENPQVCSLFMDAYKLYGNKLDSDWFFSKINELKKSFMEEFQKSQMMTKEKENAINIAGGLTPKNNTNDGTPLSERNAFDMSQNELKRAVVDYFNRT